MPYVLQHKETGQIYTSTLVNNYGLAYYGVKFWMELEEAEAQALSYLETQSAPELSRWQLIELEENEMKICNVKLRNSAQLQLFWSFATRKPEVRKLEN
ncbi:hypothetical protein A8709_19315 [Paenibacillus pectinilyticus]|uniref:Uncharacterized protein n=1 Tax=Paenibacillus pectinilyticus TaxID=512399 RepID=A0A1C1A020_9BACL|nr:hypothetical protein [Paenibacillus pectinilyticus]OCT13732.1 hypothetical protein A8709_19315 [Paenibacillus pectinilyticus]